MSLTFLTALCYMLACLGCGEFYRWAYRRRGQPIKGGGYVAAMTLGPVLFVLATVMVVIDRVRRRR